MYQHVKLHVTLFQHGMAEYFLNNKSLSDFGIVPSKADGSLAIMGGFDLPSRSGTSFYNWPRENSVEAYVDSDEIVFSEREIKFSGTILGDVNTNIKLLVTYIDSLPEICSLSCKWGTWQVKIKKQLTITPIDRNNSRISITFTEPQPDLTGQLPSPTGKDDIDGYAWKNFGLWLENISGGQDIAGLKNLNVTQNPTYTLPSTGGREKTEIIVNGNFLCSNFSEFKENVRSLYVLFGKPGLRKIKYRDIEYSCFATDGFSVSNILVNNIVSAKFQSKLIVVEKNGII